MKKIAWNKGLKGFRHSGSFQKGHIVTENIRLKMRERKLKNPVRYWLGKNRDKKTIEKLILAHKGKKLTDEHKKKLSGKRPWNKGIHMWKDRQHPRGMLNKTLSEETKKIISENAKCLWQNPEYREKVIKNSVKGLLIKPNKGEKEIYEILQSRFPNEFMYSGDGKVVFPCGCPDFWNINGQKKAINFNGLYWHLWKLQKQNPNLTKEIIEQKDIEKYKKYGIDLLVIWEDELKNKQEVLSKINNFMKVIR